MIERFRFTVSKAQPRRIFAEWFPASSYEIAEGYHIEYYSDPANYEMGMQDPEYYAEVWIPVKEK